MKNKKKMDEQMKLIIDLKKQLKLKELQLQNAYFDYYIASGLKTKQAEGMI